MRKIVTEAIVLKITKCDLVGKPFIPLFTIPSPKTTHRTLNVFPTYSKYVENVMSAVINDALKCSDDINIVYYLINHVSLRKNPETSFVFWTFLWFEFHGFIFGVF